MKFFKSLLCVCCCVSLLTGGFAVDAAENELIIKKIGIDKNLITIEAAYTEENEKISLRVEKAECEHGLNDSTFVVMQGVVQDKAVSFEFEMPEEKNGESSTGTYNVYMKAGKNPAVTDHFDYVCEGDISDFVGLLKNADAQIVGATETEITTSANTAFSPFFAEEYKAQLNALGINLELFLSMTENVRQGTAYLIHRDGIAGADTDAARKIVTAAFGISVYNSGEKEKAIQILDSDCDNVKANAVAGYMANHYSTSEQIYAALDVATALYEINSSRVNNLLSKLDTYSELLGISDIVTNIKALSQTQPTVQNTILEKAVLAMKNTPAKSAEQLKSLLQTSYSQATVVNPGNDFGIEQGGSYVGSSGGGGGGASSGLGSITIPAVGAVNQTDVKPEGKATFADVDEKHWAYESIKYLYDKKVISGDGNGEFEPDRFVTREEFVKMIVEACNIAATSENTLFSDVESGSWYEEYISAAVKNGLITGMDNNKFGVGLNITREDIAVISLRAQKSLSAELKKVREYTVFNDETNISEYAIEGVKALNEAGILNGRGNDCFEPKAFATRAEAAKIIYEILGVKK